MLSGVSPLENHAHQGEETALTCLIRLAAKGFLMGVYAEREIFIKMAIIKDLRTRAIH